MTDPPPFPSADTPTPPAWLARVRARLDDDPRDPPTREELAREAGVHPSYVSRAFRLHFGVTMTAFLRARRLDDVKRWLAWTDEPVAEVARRCGFSDQGHLAREFRRATGLTPAAWRRAWYAREITLRRGFLPRAS